MFKRYWDFVAFSVAWLLIFFSPEIAAKTSLSYRHLIGLAFIFFLFFLLRLPLRLKTAKKKLSSHSDPDVAALAEGRIGITEYRRRKETQEGISSPGKTNMERELGTLKTPRLLTEEELELTKWLLRNGSAGAGNFVQQLEHAAVIAHCKCGCASIDFSIDGRVPQKAGISVLSDFQWRDSRGHLFGIFVFERDDLLSGLDVWSIDGEETPTTLPPADLLKPYGTPDH